MITPENTEILKLALAINHGEAVGLRSLDLRLMRTYPAIIQQGELLTRIHQLVSLGALAWKQENSSVAITAHGKTLVLNATEQLASGTTNDS